MARTPRTPSNRGSEPGDDDNGNASMPRRSSNRTSSSRPGPRSVRTPSSGAGKPSAKPNRKPGAQAAAKPKPFLATKTAPKPASKSAPQRSPAGRSVPSRAPKGKPATPTETAKPARTRSGGRGGETGHILPTRTDTSSTILGPRGFTAKRIALLSLLIIVLLASVTVPLRNHYHFVSEQTRVAQEKAALEETIVQLRESKANLDDPAYIREQARLRFGVVMPGETPYRVPRVDQAQRAEEQKQAEDEAKRWYSEVWDSISAPAKPGLPDNSGVASRDQSQQNGQR